MMGNRKNYIKGDCLDENIVQKFQRLSVTVQKDISPEASFWKKKLIIIDFLWEKIRYNTELIDYIQYRFYLKKRAERNQFITHGKLVKIIKVCNDPNSRKLFDQKPLFNMEFNDYLGRNWLDSNTCSLKEFTQFINSNSKVFCKLPDGMYGKGIEIVNTNEIKDINKFYKFCKDNKTLLEEVIIQNETLAEFNSSAVNSLRIVTLVCADQNVKVMAAVLRLSRKGEFADNFHHKGIASLIDIKTGIVYTVGVDHKWNRYVVHPDSQKKIVGYQIPQWEKILTTITTVAKIHPEVRYVGWDVTIHRDGEIVIIEGNPGADPDVTQIPDQIGKWPLYEPLLNALKNVKTKQ